MVHRSQIIALVVLVLLAGFFAGITVAFTRINRLRVEIKKKQGKMAGRILSRFNEQPGRFIATSLTGFTVVLVAYCLLVAQIVHASWVAAVPDTAGSATYLPLLIEIFCATLILLIFGLLIPRSLFRAGAEKLLVWLAVPVSCFSYLLYPLSALMTGLSKWMLKYLFNVRILDEKDPFEIGDPENFLLQTQPHHLENQQLNTQLFENALLLAQVKVRECMIPRKEVASMPVSSTVREVTERFIDTKLSKLVIYEHNIDNILGYIHQRDLFTGPADIRSVVHPMLAVPETMSATNLLSRFTREHKSIAWVVDEFGGTAGIVTLEDLLEEIFGEIRDEHDVEEFVEKQIAEKEYIFSGRLEIDHLNQKYDFDFPDTESETLSGFIIAHHETIPKVRERIIIDDFEFDILNVTETRIEMVKMRVLR